MNTIKYSLLFQRNILKEKYPSPFKKKKIILIKQHLEVPLFFSNTIQESPEI